MIEFLLRNGAGTVSVQPAEGGTVSNEDGSAATASVEDVKAEVS